MARKFSELRNQMPPASQARAAARTEAMRAAQASVSKLEHRDDMYVSTLREYVKALGGELQLVASFPDADIRLQPFGPAH